MSKTIDEKVVEMRFDNKDFESNIKDTMKTLEQFKKQLKFDGASEGLENISKQAGKVNLNGLSEAVETVKVRFSALEVIAITALTNITNRAIQAGERILKAFTITPVMDGLKEYELQIDSVQTIMANTGDSVDKVNEKLDELNEYADLTIYNFSEMTRNVGTFTAALGKGSLETSTRALKGIGNWAAYAGASSEDMARASQYLAQGLQSGYISLRTWYTVMHTRGMAGENFREAFKQTAREVGINVDAIIEKAGSFNESLQEGWLNTEVFMKTMDKFAADPAMTDAATKIKTFSQLVSVIKEALGTGWAETWRYIIGDFEQAKETFSQIGDFLTGPEGIITRISKARNDLIKSAMGKTIGEFAQKFKDLVKPIENSANSVKEVINSVQDYTKIVDEIISGKWGNGESRWNKLTEAGYDWAHAQNLVNERLGSSVRHATDFSEKQEELVKSEEKVSEATSKYIDELANLSREELKAKGFTEQQIREFELLKSLADSLGLSVGELVDKSDKLNGRYMLIESFANIGRSLITIFSSLGKAFRDAFPPITADTLFNIITGMYRLSNIVKNYVDRNAENLTRTFRGLFSVLSVIANIVKGVLRVGFKALEVVLGIFGKTSEGVLDVTANLGDILTFISNILNKYIITAFDKVINLMDLIVNTIKKVIHSNETLASVFNFVRNSFHNIIESIKSFLSNSDGLNNKLSTIKTNIINVVTNIKKWIEQNTIISKSVNKLKEILMNVKEGIVEFIQNNEKLHNIFEKIKTIIDNVIESFRKFKNSFQNSFQNTDNIGFNIVEGLINGLKGGIRKVVEVIMSIANKIKETFCKLLGIHSPSTVFIEYGKNIILGLISGLKSMFPNITTIFENIYNKIKDISFGSIADILFPLTSIIPSLSFLNLPRQFLNLFKACGIQSLAGLQEGLQNKTGVIGTIIDLANKIISKFKSILGIESPSKVFIEFGKNILDGLINGIKNGFGKILEVFGELGNKIVEGFKSINFGNIAAIILATSMFVLVGKLIKVVSSLGIDILKGYADSLKAQKIQAEANKIKSIGEVVKNIGIAIALMAASIYLISKIKEPWKAFAVIAALSGCIVAMYGLITLISHFDKTNQANKGINTVLKIAASILLIAMAINLISKYKIGDESIDVMIGLISIIGLFIALIKITTLAGPNSDKAGDMILKISASMLLMILAIKMISKMDPADIYKGIAVISTLAIIIGALIVVSKSASEYNKDTGTMLLEIAGAILILTYVIKLISKMDPLDIFKGIVVITAIGVLISLFVNSIKASGSDFKSIGTMMLAMSASIILIIIAIKMISSISVSELIKGGIVITAIGVLISLFINSIKASGSDFKSIGIMVLAISGSILMLVGALMLLTKIDATELYKRLPIILLLGAMFGALVAIANSAKNAMGTIITITIAIALLIGAVALLTLLDPDKLRNAALCVSLIIGVFAAFVGISKFAGGFGKVFGTLLALELAMLGLVGILYLMEKANLQSGLKNTAILTILLSSMTAVLGVLALIGLGGPAALIGVGSFAVLELAMFLLVGLLAVMEKADLKSGMENTAILTILLSSMVSVLGVLALIGLGGPAALVGIGSLAALIGALALILPQLAKISDDTRELINRGGDILAQFGYIIGEFIGSIITGFSDAVIGSLPKVAQALSDFMTNISGFISGANNMDSLTLEGIKNLAEAIILITAADLISGISNFLHLGNNSLGNFGTQLEALGSGLNSFISSIQDINPENKAKIETACEAIKMLAEANKAVPNTGGLLSHIIGDNNLSDFGEQIKNLGTGLNDFITSLTDFNTESVPLVEAACNAIKAIAEANDAVPNTGGLLSKIIGDNNLSDFGEQIKNLGAGLNSFVTSLTDFSPESKPLIDAACEAVKSIANLGTSIGDSSWFSKLIGQSDLEKFSTEIPKLGKGVNGFIVELGQFGDDKLAVVSSACEAILAISDLGRIDLATLSSNLNDFGTKLISFGSSISVFITDISNLGMDTIAESISKVQQLINMSSNVASISVDSIAVFSDSLVQFATEGVTGFCEAFSGFEPVERAKEAINLLLLEVILKIEEYEPKFKTAFEELMKCAIDGIKSKKEDVINTIKEICNSAIDTVRSKYSEMEAAGNYFALGFVEGIRQKIEEAARIAAEMAHAAYLAAQAAIDSHSPSKETMKLGNYFGEGFVIGIKDCFSQVYDTAFDSGELARSGLNDAIQKINRIISDNIDTQPRITPVLDLSNIKSGMGDLNSMLNTSSSGINNNVNAINNLKSQNQNGSGKIVSAIEKLAEDLRMSNGNTINIYTQHLDDNEMRRVIDTIDAELGKVYN